MHDGETEIVVADDGLRRTSKRELPAAKGIRKEVVHRVAAPRQILRGQRPLRMTSNNI